MSFAIRARSSWRLPAAGLALATAAAVLTACTGGGGLSGAAGGHAGQAEQPPPKPAPIIKISPAKGSAKVKPDKSVVVTSAQGTLDQVIVEADGAVVDGEYDTTRTRWSSKGPLKPSARYTVTAKATGEGTTTTATSQFSTLKPRLPLQVADVTPNVKGETVGVGMPITVTFNQAVKDKAAVEAALEIDAQKPVEGAWRWLTDSVVMYRTAKYWPAHQKVTVKAHLEGVHGGTDMWGVADHESTVKIGARWISTVNAKTHMMYVRKDGKTIQTMKISAGRGTTREYTTTSGIHLTMEAVNPVTMISPGKKEGDPGYYKEVVNYAVRISNSGEYVHSAPWSVGSQGHANVSHGCVNASPSQAKWFYDNFHRGDVVVVTGTSRILEWNNGWGYWQMPFKQWKKGSALES